jgi:hypothetical protein
MQKQSKIGSQKLLIDRFIKIIIFFHLIIKIKIKIVIKKLLVINFNNLQFSKCLIFTQHQFLNQDNRKKEATLFRKLIKIMIKQTN